MKVTHAKIIISGSTIEAYNYREAGVAYDYEIPKQYRKKKRIVILTEQDKLRKIASRESSMRRAGSTLRRLINTNAWKYIKPNGKLYIPVFVTLTFNENIKDFKVANPIFSKFIKRLNYEITGGDKAGFLKYVVVVEFQDKHGRGAIHYHVVFFNLKHIWKDRLAEIWNHGFIDIKKIKKVTNIGAYVSKYMSKNFDDDRLDGFKRYFSSRGLIKPTVVKDEISALKILELLPKKYLKRQKEFTSRKKGKVDYSQYLLPEKQSLFDLVPETKDFI